MRKARTVEDFLLQAFEAYDGKYSYPNLTRYSDVRDSAYVDV